MDLRTDEKLLPTLGTRQTNIRTDSPVFIIPGSFDVESPGWTELDFPQGQIILTEKLGEGSYGQVFRASKLPHISATFVIKFFHAGDLGQQTDDYTEEINNLRRLKVAFAGCTAPVTCLLAAFQVRLPSLGQRAWAIVSVDRGTITLNKYFQNKIRQPNATCSIRDLWFKLFSESMDLLRLLHTKGFFLRDIKNENILVRESDGKVIFIDFGSMTTEADLDRLMSTIFEFDEDENTFFVGDVDLFRNDFLFSPTTEAFASPEYVLAMERFRQVPADAAVFGSMNMAALIARNDVYSLATTFLFLLLRKDPSFVFEYKPTKDILADTGLLDKIVIDSINIHDPTPTRMVLSEAFAKMNDYWKGLISSSKIPIVEADAIVLLQRINAFDFSPVFAASTGLSVPAATVMRASDDVWDEMFPAFFTLNYAPSIIPHRSPPPTTLVGFYVSKHELVVLAEKSGLPLNKDSKKGDLYYAVLNTLLRHEAITSFTLLPKSKDMVSLDLVLRNNTEICRNVMFLFIYEIVFKINLLALGYSPDPSKPGHSRWPTKNFGLEHIRFDARSRKLVFINTTLLLFSDSPSFYDSTTLFRLIAEIYSMLSLKQVLAYQGLAALRAFFNLDTQGKWEGFLQLVQEECFPCPTSVWLIPETLRHAYAGLDLVWMSFDLLRQLLYLKEIDDNTKLVRRIQALLALDRALTPQDMTAVSQLVTPNTRDLWKRIVQLVEERRLNAELLETFLRARRTQPSAKLLRADNKHELCEEIRRITLDGFFPL